MMKKGNFKENHKKKVNVQKPSTVMRSVGKEKKKKLDKNTIYAWILLVFFVFWTIAGILGSIAFFRKDNSSAVVANAAEVEDRVDALYAQNPFPECLSILDNRSKYLGWCEIEAPDGFIPGSIELETFSSNGFVYVDIIGVSNESADMPEGLYTIENVFDSIIAWYGQVRYSDYIIGADASLTDNPSVLCGSYNWSTDDFQYFGGGNGQFDGAWIDSGHTFAFSMEDGATLGFLDGNSFVFDIRIGSNQMSNKELVYVYDLYDNLFDFGYALGYYNSIYDNRTNTFYMSNAILYCWNQDLTAVETIYDTPNPDEGQINFGDYYKFALDELGHGFYRFDCVFEFVEELKYNPIGLSYYSFITDNAELLPLMPQVYVGYKVDGVGKSAVVPWSAVQRNTALGLETEYFLDFSGVEIPHNAVLVQAEYIFDEFNLVFYEYDYDYFAQNYLAGYYQGFDAGETAGWNKGYQEGKADGVEQASNHTFYTLISAVVDVPVRTFMSLFNFEILGVNMANFALGIFSMCLVLAIIKLIL